MYSTSFPFWWNNYIVSTSPFSEYTCTKIHLLLFIELGISSTQLHTLHQHYQHMFSSGQIFEYITYSCIPTYPPQPCPIFSENLKHKWTDIPFAWTQLSRTEPWPQFKHLNYSTQITKFMGPTWGPPGSCRAQMGPMSHAIREGSLSHQAVNCYGTGCVMQSCPR